MSRLTLDDAPFEMYTLDPRDSFVVYANDIGNKPIFGVKYSTDEFRYSYLLYLFQKPLLES